MYSIQEQSEATDSVELQCPEIELFKFIDDSSQGNELFQHAKSV